MQTPDKPADLNCCQFCDAETDDLHFANMRYTPDGGLWLCDVCFSTPAGNAAQFPDQYEGQVPILRTIAWGINRILAEIRSRPNEAKIERLTDAAKAMVEWADIQAGGRAGRPEISALREAIEFSRRNDQ